MAVHHHHHRSSREKNSRVAIVLPLAMVAVVLLSLVLLGVDTSRSGGPNSSPSDTVEIGGVACTPKHNLRTYLFMGIDDTGENTEEYTYGGQCDVLLLLVVDKGSKTYQQLAINRNTMTEVHSLDEDGQDLGSTHVQISYAHMAGDGGSSSCENTVRAVSDLLMGQKIDGYVSVGMESIGVLNHIAGGVTVTVEDDFSRADPSLVQGETLRLTDEQAYHFVRGRMDVGDGTNEGRMRRQDAFIEGLKASMMEKQRQDSGYALEVYRDLEDYMTTNLTEKDFSRIARALTSSDSQGELSIEGTIGLDEFEQATLEPDKESLAEAVRTLFYVPAKA